VRRAGPGYFTATERWAAGVSQAAELRLADVTGDGRADALVIERGRISVLTSTGSEFAKAVTWFEGEGPSVPGWFFADVDGDGAADAIALDAFGSRVLLSDGQRFARKAGSFERVIPLGERGNTFTDVDGDGHADAIVHHHGSIEVQLASSDEFGETHPWSRLAYYGGL
jgi:hypothetical protein